MGIDCKRQTIAEPRQHRGLTASWNAGRLRGSHGLHPGSQPSALWGAGTSHPPPSTRGDTVVPSSTSTGAVPAVPPTRSQHPRRGLCSVALPGLTRSQGTTCQPGAGAAVSSPFSPRCRLLRLIVMYYLLTSAATLARRRFLRTAALAVTGSGRTGQGSASNVGAVSVPGPAIPWGCPTALEMPQLPHSHSIPTPRSPSLAVPVPALMSPLPQARCECAQRTSRFSFFLKLFLFRLSFLNLISR